MFNFRRRLSSFLYGRYGMDSLGKFQIIMCFVLAVLSIFIRDLTASVILSTVQTANLAFIIFRVFSRNYSARAAENTAYLKMANFFKRKFRNIKMRLSDINYRRYRTCPNCKAISRLPIKRGRHKVKCPACKTEFKVFIFI